MRPRCNRASSGRSRSYSNIPERPPAHVVVAPDKFKGSLTASEAALAIERGLRAVWPACEIVLVPMADGGEGTVDAFLASGWTRASCRVRGPLGDPVDASFAAAHERTPAAVIEMAAASGLALVRPERYDPLHATTFGTGELVRAALDRGARSIVVGLGGSATCDGGAGFLEALGARFLTRDGREVERGGIGLGQLAQVDRGSLDPRLRGVRFLCATDVDAPLLGPRGASRGYAVQKGASRVEVDMLERALARFADVVAMSGVADVRDEPGCGAAGGLGFALRSFLGAELARGVDVVADTRGLAERLVGAAWCFTGEGSLDAQTLAGKTVAGVADRARTAGVRTVVFAGRVEPGAARTLAARGVIVVPLAETPLARSESIARGGELLERAAARVARTIAASDEYRSNA